MAVRAWAAVALIGALCTAPGCAIKKIRFTPPADGGAGGHDAGSTTGAGGHRDAGGSDSAGGAGGHAVVPDAAAVDAPARDAVAAEAGTKDAAPHDAGTKDAAIADAGAGGHPGTDAGRIDARDAGPVNCATNLVPTLTAATSGGVINSGSYNSTSYDAWQAFDASDTSMWISPSGQNPTWIGYSWGDGPRTVLSYAITYANGTILTRAPSAWTLQGLMGDVWVTLDSRVAQTNWAGFERRVYAVAAPGSYPQLRLSFTDDNDPSAGIVVISVGRIELLGCPP